MRSLLPAMLAAASFAACAVDTDRPLLDQPDGLAVEAFLRVPARAAGEDVPRDVPTNVIVRVGLERFPDPASIDASSVRLVAGGADLPAASVVYDALDNEIVVVPGGACPDDPTELRCLPASASVEVVVGPGIVSDGRPFPAGVPMPEEVRLSFETGIGPDREPPVVPACGAECWFSVFPEEVEAFEFSPSPYVLRADVDEAAIADDTSSPGEITLVAYAGPLPGAQDFSAPSRVVRLGAEVGTHRILGLGEGLEYWVIVRARDAAGNESTNLDEQSAVTGVFASGEDWRAAYEAIACHCGSCHRSARAPYGFVLPDPLDTTVDVYDAIVGRPSAEVPSMRLIEPFNAARSYIVLKMAGMAGAAPDFGADIVGFSMSEGGPLDVQGDPLLRGILEAAFARWIDRGAPRDAILDRSCE